MLTDGPNKKSRLYPFGRRTLRCRFGPGSIPLLLLPDQAASASGFLRQFASGGAWRVPHPRRLRAWPHPRMDAIPMKTKTGISQAFSGNTRRPSILSPAQTMHPTADFCKRTKNDQLGYSCERTPWVLVTGVEPLDRSHPAPPNLREPLTHDVRLRLKQSQ
jgi:hypothetical protein